jgi:ABC-type multidrug transport system ATPase subunit
MAELLRLHAVRLAPVDKVYSVTLSTGELRLLQLATPAEKEAMIDLVTGVVPARIGSVQIVQGERRFNKAAKPAGERRIKNEALPLIWQSLRKARAGRIAWVAANGGLISNLKVWENVTLPLWHHFRHDVVEAERRIRYWLELLGVEPVSYADLMASPPASLASWQRKLVGLLRGLVQMPQLLVLDANLFESIDESTAAKWLTALERYAVENGAVLALADRTTMLPWQKIE